MRRSYLIYILMGLAAACSSIQKAAAPPTPSFGAVRNELIICEANEAAAVCEERTRDHLRHPWGPAEQAELRYFLARFLAKQGRHDKAILLLRDLPEGTHYLRDGRKLGAESAFAAGDWNGAIDFALAVYLSLSPEEKIPMSRIVFLSYLYRGDTEKAARWYAKLSAEKRAVSDREKDEFLARDPAVREGFDRALARFEGREEPATPAAPVVPAAPAVTEEVTAEALPEMAPPIAEVPVPADALLPSLDQTPDWGKVCLFLSDEDRWRKVNEVVEVFFDWMLKERPKDPLTPVALRYLTEDDLERAFAKAKEERCFAGVGPLFSDFAAEDIARLSAATPLPLFGFTPWFSDTPGLLFNLKYTKDREAADIVSWLVSRGKARFAIAYPDDVAGRRLRDLYWAAIEAAGGAVTDALAFGPGDKALLDDVEEILFLPESYRSFLYRFKQENADRYKTPTMMKRALDRIEKVTPLQADLDTLIVAASPEQTAILLPTFAYKNVEFAYVSPSEKYRIRENQKKMHEELNIPWDITTIQVAAASEVKGDAAFEKNVNKLLDGLAVAAPWQDLGDTNAPWKQFMEAFTAKFQRAPYPIERTLGEMATVLLAAREVSGRTTLAPFVGALRGVEFTSLTAGRPVRFTVRNQLSGLGEIYVGVKGKGFLPAKEVFKEEDEAKKKEEEAKKKETEKSVEPVTP